MRRLAFLLALLAPLSALADTVINGPWTAVSPGLSTSGSKVTATVNGFAAPSGLIGLSPVTGSAATGEHSDSTHALDQGIAPTWTGLHTFTAGQNNQDITSAATVGPELVTNGSFTGSATGWTLGTGWAYGTNNVIWTVGTSGDLVQAITVVADTAYLISWDQTNSATLNGSITPKIGGDVGPAVSFLPTTTLTNNQVIITATMGGLQNLVFSGTQIDSGAGTVTITNVSVKALTPVTPSLTTTDLTGGFPGPQTWSGNEAAGQRGSTFWGGAAGQNTTFGFFNTCGGYLACRDTTYGGDNTAWGYSALRSYTGSNDFGSFGDFGGMTAIGTRSLMNATAQAHDDTALGGFAMTALLTGSENTCLGYISCSAMLYGWSNTAVGDGALPFNLRGSQNVALGENSVGAEDAAGNVGVGYYALGKLANVPGSSSFFNTAVGLQAGLAQTSGTNNTYLGYQVGSTTLATGQYNLLLGTTANCDTVAAGTSNTISVCGPNGAIWSATGTDVPSTSVTTIAGGTVLGAATGGYQGPGTLNMEGCFINGAPCIGSGTVTSVASGCGLAGGPVTTTGTISASGRRSIGNTDATLVATDNANILNASLTAPRTWTLPAANALTAGCTIVVADEFGGISGTNTLTIARAGADTINGTTTYPLYSPFMSAVLKTDGSSKWTVVDAMNLPAGTSGQMWIMDSNGLPQSKTMGGDCTTSDALSLTCTKTNGAAFVASATTDTTDASNISAGVLSPAVGGTGINNGSNTLTLNSAVSLPSHPGGTECLHMSSAGTVTTTGSDCGSASGALTLISTQTATSSASLEWTGLTGKDYVLRIRNLVPGTDAITGYIQFGEGGTPTWKTANYKYGGSFYEMAANVNGGSFSANDSGFSLGGLSSTNGVVGATVNVHSLSQAVLHGAELQTATHSSDGNDYGVQISGWYSGDTTAVTAIRIIPSSGNWASGEASLYVLSD